jgi:ATP-binding cassette subfamily C (CFTR/MRP) protein 1
MEPVLGDPLDSAGRCMYNTSNDNTLGPIIRDCHHSFDFTLVFEQSFLSIGPSALILLFIPLRTWWIWKSENKARHGVASVVKQVGTANCDDGDTV